MEVRGWHKIDFTPKEAEVYYNFEGEVDKAENYKAIVGPDGRIFGIVSESYSLVHHKDVFETVETVLQQKGIEVLDRRILTSHGGARAFMEWKFDKRMQIKEGDELSVGIRALNSYDGEMGLTIESLVERLICSNGMTGIVEETVRYRRHVGISLFDVQLMVGDVLDNITTFEDRIAEIADQYIASEKAMQILQKIGIPKKYLEKGTEYGPSATELLEKYDVVSVLDLYNAITAGVTHLYEGESYGNRLDLERQVAKAVPRLIEVAR